MELSYVFSRFLPQIQELHHNIANDVFQIQKGGKYLSLVDVIFAGPKLKTVNDGKYVSDLLASIQAGEDMPAFNKHGVFDHTEISVLKAGYKFMSSICGTPWWDVAQEPEPGVEALENLSGLMVAPSTLLSLKYFWLYLEYGKDTDTRTGKVFQYNGVLANTQPVRTALKYLYGTDFVSPMRSTMQQQRMAAELGIEGLDAFNLNSALWFMGQQG